MKPHICIASQFHYSRYKGGNEKLAHQIAALTAKHFKTTYLTTESGSKSYPYQIINSQASLGTSYAISPSFIKRALHLNPTIIYTMGNQASLELLRVAAYSKGITTIHAHHGPLAKNTLSSIANTPYDFWISKTSSAISVLTQRAKEGYAHQHSNIHVVSPHAPPLKSAKRKSSHTICMIAALDSHHYYKGVDQALRALAILPTQWKLIVIGDGAQKQKYQALSGQLSAKDRVTFLGRCTEKEKLEILAKSRVFIMPSTSKAEGFGIAILEALAVQTPAVITTHVGFSSTIGSTDIIQIIPPLNPKILSKAIEKAPVKPNKKDFHSIIGNYSAEKTQGQLLKMYNSLLQ